MMIMMMLDYSVILNVYLRVFRARQSWWWW